MNRRLSMWAVTQNISSSAISHLDKDGGGAKNGGASPAIAHAGAKTIGDFIHAAVSCFRYLCLSSFSTYCFLKSIF